MAVLWCLCHVGRGHRHAWPDQTPHKHAHKTDPHTHTHNNKNKNNKKKISREQRINMKLRYGRWGRGEGVLEQQASTCLLESVNHCSAGLSVLFQVGLVFGLGQGLGADLGHGLGVGPWSSFCSLTWIRIGMIWTWTLRILLLIWTHHHHPKLRDRTKTIGKKKKKKHTSTSSSESNLLAGPFLHSNPN